MTLALVVAPIAGCAGLGADSFCTAIGAGRTAIDAARKFVADCRGDYRITRGPYDADKETTPFANYAQVTEFTISVANNSEGSLGFLIVGRRTRHEPWRTLEPLGTGPWASREQTITLSLICAGSPRQGRVGVVAVSGCVL